MDILGALTPEPLIVADRHRAAPTLDAEVKTLLLLPPGAEVAGDGLAFERDLAAGRLFRAVQPGIFQASAGAGVWARRSSETRPKAMSVSLNTAIWRRTRMSKSKARARRRPW